MPININNNFGPITHIENFNGTIQNGIPVPHAETTPATCEQDSMEAEVVGNPAPANPWEGKDIQFFNTRYYTPQECYDKLMSVLASSSVNQEVLRNLQDPADGGAYFQLNRYQYTQRARLLNQFAATPDRFKAQDFADLYRARKKS